MSDNSYKDVIKTNTAIGGVRAFQMIINIVRTKIFAVFLGAAGMGVQSLLTATLQTLHQFSTFGIFKSAVRDISISKASGEQDKVKKTISVFNVLVLFFGVFGVIVCASFSSVLSKSVFGNSDYTWAFVIVSLALFFEAFTNGFITIFQGLRLVKKLAISSLVGALVSLVAIVPLIVIWKDKAIPYAIVVNYFCIMLVYYFSYRRNVSNIGLHFDFNKTEIKQIGKPILKNGTLLMLSYCIYSLVGLLTSSFIARMSDMETVGFFNAANGCTYANIAIFTYVLSSDYYPRMSALFHDKVAFGDMYNKQIEIVILGLTPIVCLFIVFAKYIVIILYSHEFLIIIDYVRIMAMSLLLRIVWQTCSTTFMASGHNKLYLWFDAIVGNGLFLLFNMLAFYYWGLKGISYSFIVSSLVVLVLLVFVVKKVTTARMKKKVIWLLVASLLSLAVLYCCVTYLAGVWQIVFSSIVSICVLFVSLFLLNRRMNLKEVFHSIRVRIYGNKKQ